MQSAGPFTGPRMSTPPTHIYTSMRSRRDFVHRHAASGPSLLLIVLVLLVFWAAVGIGTAAAFGAL